MNPLALDAETMRAIGHRTVDRMVAVLGEERPALRCASPAEMAERLPFGVPEAPGCYDALLARLERDVLPYAACAGHPGYMAFIPSCGTFPAALGDFIAAALNIYAGSWMEAAGPSRLELVVLDWFKQWIGYPPAAEGLLVSGGSAANVTAIACAREALIGPMDDRATVYMGDQGHVSIEHAARLLGFRPDRIRVLPSDAGHRLPPRAVASAIEADAARGLRPLLVAAAAGATNTGAIDPLADLAAVCREHGVWLHVDAAYGGFAALTDRGRRALAGLELADSVTLDPHKWLYQPIECGSLLVREPGLLEQAFAMDAPYLHDVAAGEGAVNFSDRGPQSTRAFRALKVWLSVGYFGAGAFRAAIDRALDVAEHARELIAADPALELVAPGELGIVCFRRAVEGGEEEAARVNGALIAAYHGGGRGFVSSTRLHGRFAVRLCALSHTTTEADVEAVIGFFAAAPVAYGSSARPASTSIPISS